MTNIDGQFWTATRFTTDATKRVGEARSIMSGYSFGPTDTQGASKLPGNRETLARDQIELVGKDVGNVLQMAGLPLTNPTRNALVQAGKDAATSVAFLSSPNSTPAQALDLFDKLQTSVAASGAGLIADNR